MKVFNRNHIKIIALISMFLDHIGIVLFPHIIWFRVVGRLAFPLFAFFIAEGFFYTKSKPKYILLLLVFAILSVYPYFLMKEDWLKFNILFSFLFSVCIMWLIEKLYSVESFTKFAYAILILLVVSVAMFLAMTGCLEYGLLGVVLPVVLWLFKRKPPIQLVLMALLLLIYYFEIIMFNSFEFSYQIFSLLSVLILIFYNSKKGDINLKYLFYIFYPLHFVILYLLKIVIF